MRSLRHLFHTAVTMTLTAGCGGLAAGGESAPPPDAGRDGDVRLASIDRTGFDLTVCDGNHYNPVSGVTEVQQHDYLELRAENRLDTSPPTPTRVVAKDGIPCATATTPACKDALATLRTGGTGWFPHSSGGGEWPSPEVEYLVYTRGDEVGAITDASAVPDFVAPVDTVKDAALILAIRGHYIRCDGRPNGRKTTRGWEIITETGYTCGGPGIFENIVAVAPDGTHQVKESVKIQPGDDNCVIGRRPEGLVAAPRRKDGVGPYFADAARLEAASVVAFERLAAELRAHGAPDDLVRDALRAAEDEVRHARATQAIAERHGAAVEPPRVDECPVRPLFAVALENAIEGCVRETFGALVATYQARKATDPAIKRLMTTIAEDETRHADLAWRIAAWAEPQLDEAERERVRAARAGAVDELRRAIAKEPDGELVAVAGLPSARDALTLFGAVAPELWA